MLPAESHGTRVLGLQVLDGSGIYSLEFGCTEDVPGLRHTVQVKEEVPSLRYTGTLYWLWKIFLAPVLRKKFLTGD